MGLCSRLPVVRRTHEFQTTHDLSSAFVTKDRVLDARDDVGKACVSNWWRTPRVPMAGEIHWNDESRATETSCSASGNSEGMIYIEDNIVKRFNISHVHSRLMRSHAHR